MKLLDEVKLLNDNYKSKGLTKGMIGTIVDADVRWNCFCVNFQDQRIYDKSFIFSEENLLKLKNDIYTEIKIEDMEVIKSMQVKLMGYLFPGPGIMERSMKPRKLLGMNLKQMIILLR